MWRASRLPGRGRPAREIGASLPAKAAKVAKRRVADGGEVMSVAAAMRRQRHAKPDKTKLQDIYLAAALAGDRRILDEHNAAMAKLFEAAFEVARLTNLAVAAAAVQGVAERLSGLDLGSKSRGRPAGSKQYERWRLALQMIKAGLFRAGGNRPLSDAKFANELHRKCPGQYGYSVAAIQKQMSEVRRLDRRARSGDTAAFNQINNELHDGLKKAIKSGEKL